MFSISGVSYISGVLLVNVCVIKGGIMLIDWNVLENVGYI